ncbi:MAG: ATP-binding protein [Acholeplasmatales bacterium]|nr:ATP-binding protein [Acholeplasmatales bacterium]
MFKSEIAPKGIQFRPADFSISDKYATILTVISYPRYIGTGYLASLTNMSGIKLVIKHMPLPFSVLSKMLNKEIADLRARYQQEKDVTIQERIRQDMDSLEYYIQQFTASQTKTFDFQMHLLVTADTKEQLESRKLSLKNYLDAMEMRAVPLRFEQEHVLKSMLPVFEKQVIEDRIGTPMPSSTMAAMYPFVFDSIKDDGLSTLLGVDFSGGVVLFNQFLYQIRKENNRNNANMIILGSSGSGKSTAAKMILRSHIRNGYQIVAIDPEGEISEMTRNYGGEVIDLGKGGAYGLINPLEIIADIDEEDAKNGQSYTVLNTTLQNLKAFMKYYSPDIEEDVLNMFSEVVQDTYARFGINFNSDFSSYKSSDFPVMQDVYATIIGRLRSMTEKTRERDIMERLEIKIRPFTRELKYYFNGHTSINSSGDFLVFNIKELMNSDANIRNALLFNVLKFAWGLCLNPEVNTVLSVDEAHVLLGAKNTLGAEFLAQVQRRARKYNTGTIIITQQPSDFVGQDILVHGKAIFDNSSYYLVMGLRKQSVDDLSLLIDLNDNERESIKRYNQGDALFVCGSRRMQINVIVSEDELESFGVGGGL